MQSLIILSDQLKKTEAFLTFLCWKSLPTIDIRQEENR